MRPLPQDSRSVVDRVTCQHPGLLLERYFGWTEGYGEREEADKKFESWSVQALTAGIRLVEPWQALARERAERFDQRVKALAARGSVRVLTRDTASRTLVGHGAVAARENSLTLQRPSGLPLVPGSAQKGLARAVALAELAERLGVPAQNPADLAAERETAQRERRVPPPTPYERLEALAAAEPEQRDEPWQALVQAMADKGLQPADALDTVRADLSRFGDVFGRLGRAGGVVFLDAELTADSVESVVFEVDVLNPHLPDYYRNKQAPGPWQDPQPIFFLTLAPGLGFRFAVFAPVRAAATASPDYDARRAAAGDLTNSASVWLRRGLETHGIGAKTNAGYGRFRVRKTAT